MPDKLSTPVSSRLRHRASHKPVSQEDEDVMAADLVATLMAQIRQKRDEMEHRLVRDMSEVVTEEVVRDTVTDKMKRIDTTVGKLENRMLSKKRRLSEAASNQPTSRKETGKRRGPPINIKRRRAAGTNEGTHTFPHLYLSLSLYKARRMARDRKENVDESEDEGKENSAPGHDAMEIDKVMDADTVEKNSTVAAAPKGTVSIDGEKECSKDTTVSGSAAAAAGAVAQPRPEPYQEITQSIIRAKIRDGNDYGGDICSCTDGKCGVSCVLRYLTVECGMKCRSGDGCQNRAMQKATGSRVEVFHTGTQKGFGMRALEPIKKGAFISEYLGEVMTHEQGEKRKNKYAEESPPRRHHYMMTLTDSDNQPFIIDATKYGNCSRFINHSCEPNAICDKWSVNRYFRMGFFAGRNIEVGEEITFDYRFQNYGRTLIECICGTPKCRKYMASKDDAKEVPTPISTPEMSEKDEKKKLQQRRFDFRTRSEKVLKRYVKASMFKDVDDCKRTLRKIIDYCIEQGQKRSGRRFDFSLSDDVKHRMVEYTKKYVLSQNLKPLS